MPDSTICSDDVSGLSREVESWTSRKGAKSVGELFEFSA